MFTDSYDTKTLRICDDRVCISYRGLNSTAAYIVKIAIIYPFQDDTSVLHDFDKGVSEPIKDIRCTTVYNVDTMQFEKLLEQCTDASHVVVGILALAKTRKTFELPIEYWGEL